MQAMAWKVYQSVQLSVCGFDRTQDTLFVPIWLHMSVLTPNWVVMQGRAILQLLILSSYQGPCVSVHTLITSN